MAGSVMVVSSRNSSVRVVTVPVAGQVQVRLGPPQQVRPGRGGFAPQPPGREVAVSQQQHARRALPTRAAATSARASRRCRTYTNILWNDLTPKLLPERVDLGRSDVLQELHHMITTTRRHGIDPPGNRSTPTSYQRRHLSSWDWA